MWSDALQAVLSCSLDFERADDSTRRASNWKGSSFFTTRAAHLHVGMGLDPYYMQGLSRLCLSPKRSHAQNGYGNCLN